MSFTGNLAVKEETMNPSLNAELRRCQKWIEDALGYAGGTHDYEDIVESVHKGRMQLWAGEEGCAITEIIKYPKMSTLHVFLAGGKMEQIIDFQTSAAEFAKMNGCSKMTLAGRHGWTRVLSKHGWEHSFSVMSKEA